MFRKERLWLITGGLRFVLTFAVLAGLLAGVAMSSFAFEYTGIHWYDTDLPVTWEINQNGTTDCTGEFQAVRAAYQTWEDVAGSYFTETYLGTTTGGLGYDGHNVVSWGDSEPEGVLAVCYTWYDSGTGRIFECDIEFQDKYTWSSTGEGGKYDVQNIGTHEFGHTLLLGDLYGPGDSEKTMYGYASAGETKKRTLHQDDIDGISYIYPESVNQPPNTPPAPTGPDSGTPGTSYSFTATTTDPDGDQVAFKFDWGDGSESGWTSFVESRGSASMSHSWSNQGTFDVRARAKDTYGAESGWSSGHEIVIRVILLEVEPSSLDFGEMAKSSTKTMTYRAYNAGGGTLSGNVSDNRDWISVNPTSFEGNDNEISVTVETERLAESLTPYTGTITITSNGGTKTVEVSLIVIPTGAVAYPIPFSLSRHSNLIFWGTYVPYAKIQIFTLGGELVKTLEERNGASNLSWDGRNEKGDKVARGIYIYIVKDTTGKIAVVE
jgi:hypothetical protein